MQIAIYARYSSEMQSPTSVDDQIALCKKLIADQFGPSTITPYSDSAISGATMERPGMQALLAAVKKKQVDLVVAEGLDRLSRSMKDIAAIHETLTNYRVKIYTAHEGIVSELHVGLKGTMNALFLKDLKDKTRRGMTARIEAGYAIHPPAYGYRVKREYDPKGLPIPGLREIDPEQADVVRWIYEQYLSGQSCPKIAGELNERGIPSPLGGLWQRYTLRSSGEGRVHHGILSNEIYRGVLIHNRSRVIFDPSTGAKRAIGNPVSEWVYVDMPELRIIDDDLWQAVQERLKQRQKKQKKPRCEYRPNIRQLTNFIYCGVCGGQKHVAHQTRYVCANNRYSKACNNARGVREEIIREDVFAHLYRRVRDKKHPFKSAFEAAFVEKTRIKNEHSEQEKALLTKIDRLMQCIEDGIDVEHSTQRVLALQDELKAVRAALACHTVPDFPDEDEIQGQLWKSLKNLEDKKGREHVDVVRQMLKHLVEKVVLTPIEGKPKGEKITVHLREDGWLDYWMSLQS